VRIPLAPSAEQSRIADVLDELLSDLDAGVAALELVRAKLALYRASILKAAVDGTLTAEWRAQHPNIEPASGVLERALTERRRRWEEEQLAKFQAKRREPPKNWKAKYRDPKLPDSKRLSEVPSTWTQTGFEQLTDGTAHALKAGPFGSSLKKEYYTPLGYKIYGQEQVIRGDASFGDYFIAEDLFQRLKSCAVRPGDVLISLVGTAGKVLVLPDDIHPGIINPRLLKVTLSLGAVEPRFAKLVLESPHARHFFRAQAHGGTMEILNLGILKQFPIPLPPPDEQRQILDDVDDMFSVIDHVEADVDARLKAAQMLRQAILRHAFSGQLVPQDPNDEPASELLKRIAAERVARAHEAVTARHGSKRAASTPRRRRSAEQPPPGKHP
jgi:type I restriction enzyme S subunit